MIKALATGGLGVATAVLTATEGEEGAMLDTAAAAATEPGAAPVMSRARYELDPAWTEHEEQRLLEATDLYPGSASININVDQSHCRMVRL